MRLRPVLEIGGTHVTAGLVDVDSWTVIRDVRHPLDAAAPAEQLFESFAAAAALVAIGTRQWAVAIPGPFDYERGVGRFGCIGKFGALDGVDVRAGLIRCLNADTCVFVNDAEAFAVGEWHASGRPAHRAIHVTLGTGVGSSFLEGGVGVTSWPGIPEGGRAHLLEWRGRPLEETVSRAALREAYRARSGHDADVREICELARAGDVPAATTVAEAFDALGTVIGPALDAFAADEIVVGGSIAASWDIIGPTLEAAVLRVSSRRPVSIRRAAALDGAPLIGAAIAADRPR